LEHGLKVSFIEPMECLPVAKIAEGHQWTYELKLDGYRLEVVKTGGRVTLYSRGGNDLTHRFDYIAAALDSLPDETVIDGELVALDEAGRPSFNLLQNFRSAVAHIAFYAFDIMISEGHNVMLLPLAEHRTILANALSPSDHVGLSQVSDKTAAAKERPMNGTVLIAAEFHGFPPGWVFRQKDRCSISCLQTEHNGMA
jgi:bifunctional non-homologous end joining protein LigD